MVPPLGVNTKLCQIAKSTGIAKECGRLNAIFCMGAPMTLALPSVNADVSYSPELEAQDPFFNRATQAELYRRIMETPPEKCIPFDPNDPESRARVLGEEVSTIG